MRTVLVTGGASGIGKSVSEKFLDKGDQVIIVDQNEQELSKLIEQYQEQGLNAIGEYVDISSEESIIKALSNLEPILSNLSVLVNNAGVNFNLTVENCSTSQFDECISINLRGHYLITKHSLPYLKRNENSNIVNISSAHAIRTQPHFFPYNVAKSGIIGLTNSMVIDFSEYKIRANTICPGLIQTNIMDEENFTVGSEYYNKVINYHPVGRIGTPEDVSNAVVFIASPEATFINGATLLIDGGRSVLTYSL